MTTHAVRLHAGGLLLAAMCCAGPATAQSAGDGFLFKRPVGSLAVLVGFNRATAGGDLFSFVTDELTLSRGDFSAPTLGADLSFWLSPRGELTVGVAVAATRARSEFRDWVDQGNLPIEQTTTFRRAPVTVSAKWYLADRGRSIGRLAWVPARYAPYVGVGVGWTWYRFRQAGDFIDFTDNHVFRDTFQSKGWAWTGHVMTGVDVSLGARFFVTTEARYTRSRASLSRDFVGFNGIDLSGFTMTAGLAARF